MNKILYILIGLTLVWFGLWVQVWNTDIKYFPDATIFFNTKLVAWSNDYDINTFNCQDFSQALFHRLENDYNVFYVGGFSPDDEYIVIQMSKENIEKIHASKLYSNLDSPHEWIYVADYNIYIEATSGTIIPNSKIKT